MRAGGSIGLVVRGSIWAIPTLIRCLVAALPATPGRDGGPLPLPSGSQQSLPPLSLRNTGGNRGSSTPCLLCTSSVCSRRTVDCALRTVCSVSLPPSVDGISSPPHATALSTSSNLPFSPSSASSPHRHCIGLRTTSPFHPRSQSVYIFLCHCHLTHIRHSPAQVTGAVIEWDNRRLQRATLPIPRSGTEFCGATGIREEDVSDICRSAVRVARVSGHAALPLAFQPYFLCSPVLHAGGTWQPQSRHRLHAPYLWLVL